MNLTQDELAARIGISTPYIGHIESGKRHPSDEILTRLADVLGFDRRELFFVANPTTRAMLTPKSQPSDGSAWTASDCIRHVIRGGSWASSPRFLRSAYRVGTSSGHRNGTIGFRLARTL